MRSFVTILLQLFVERASKRGLKIVHCLTTKYGREYDGLVFLTHDVHMNFGIYCCCVLGY